MICSQRSEQWGKKKAERTTTSESIKRWRGQKYNEHINVNLEYLYQHLRVHELPASKLQSTKSVTNFSSNLFTACASSRASLSSSSPPNPFFFRIEFVSRCFFYSIPSNYSQIPWKIAYTFSSECSTHDKLSTDDNYLLNNAGNYAKNQQNPAPNEWVAQSGRWFHSTQNCSRAIRNRCTAIFNMQFTYVAIWNGVMPSEILQFSAFFLSQIQIN